MGGAWVHRVPMAAGGFTKHGCGTSTSQPFRRNGTLASVTRRPTAREIQKVEDRWDVTPIVWVGQCNGGHPGIQTRRHAVINFILFGGWRAEAGHTFIMLWLQLGF